MKLIAFLIGMAVLLPQGVWAESVKTDAITMEQVKTFATDNMIWHNQSCFEIRDSITIFTDPYKLEADAKADLILITHPHRDHLSLEDMKRIQTKETFIIAPDDPECREKLGESARYVNIGDTLTAKGIPILVVPAYNPNKKFHPKDKNWVGYVFTVDNIRIYTPGDTDRIPEMKKIKTDIALLPIGGHYTMDAKEASQAALDINPKLAIPMHYGGLVGTLEDANTFKKALKGKLDVLIKEIE